MLRSDAKWIAGAAMLWAIAASGPVAAQTFLSNTPVSPEDAGDLFDGAAPSLWATATEEVGDVRIRSNAFRGVTGTSAAGYFLYSYEIESLNTGTVYVTEFTVDVAGRVAFDLDSDGSPETSAYCSSSCLADVTSANVPDQVVATGDSVNFRFALLETSTQLWIVSEHPPATVTSGVTLSFGGGAIPIDVVAPSPSTAGPLSNVAVSWGTPTHSRLAALFGINLGASPGGDGYALGVHFYTGARTGNAGTEGEGLYLYEYWLETGECGGNSALVRRLDIPFDSLVPFDVDGNGTPETSFYMPYGSGCGPATVADPVEIDGSTLSFVFPSGVAGGMANAYVISDLPPQATPGILTIETVGSGPFATWSPAPEPESLIAAGAAGVALLALSRRRGSRSN